MKRTRMWNLVVAGGMVATLLVRARADGASVPEDALLKIRQNIPDHAYAVPRGPRRLLIYDANVGYGGHPSAAYATAALRLMGERTGAFEIELSNDPEVFRSESLGRFDAFFLNNNVGNLFTDPALRESLLEFIVGGGGLLGVHGTAVAFTQWPGAVEDWPEFGVILGGRGANHRDSDEHVVMKIEDTQHPLTSMFDPRGFDFRDEFFRVHEPYSRRLVRVLLSFDTERTDMHQGADRGRCHRDDDDYAIAWIRRYGQGRVFYCTIAHNPYVFWDPTMLKFYLAAVQWALGDLEASSVPSAFLGAELRAEERLGWQVGLLAPLETARSVPTRLREVAGSRLLYLGLQGVAPPAAGAAATVPSSDQVLSGIRVGLDDAGTRPVAQDLRGVDLSNHSVASWLSYARKLGLETVIADPPAEQLPQWVQALRENRLRLAIPWNVAAGNRRYNDAAQLRGLIAAPGPGTPLGVCLELDRAADSIAEVQSMVREFGPSLQVVLISAAAADRVSALEVLPRRSGQHLTVLVDGDMAVDNFKACREVLDAIGAVALRLSAASANPAIPLPAGAGASKSHGQQQ